MKILYGVQGTGNGHISRARAMAEAFSRHSEIEVTWLFSGRPRDQFFDMEVFGDYRWRRGLTFYSRAGRIRNVETAFRNKPLKFLKDRRKLDLAGYDLLISDYEPVTAWAAKREQIPAIGIGHQYAFDYDIPKDPGTVLTRAIMGNFAPMKKALGLHWHHFNQPILPPIADIGHFEALAEVERKILVYLPFEDSNALLAVLKQIPDYEFFVYAPDLTNGDFGHVHTRQPSRIGFQRDLADSERVICNAGFELISEALQIGKKILTKPLAGQMEQLSNAIALEKLSLAKVVDSVSRDVLENWLKADAEKVQVAYPDVPGALADWIADGMELPVESLSQSLWDQTRFQGGEVPAV
ncbi:MAG: MJ1255/VC2487 family glycosyltransferase [bacterium]